MAGRSNFPHALFDRKAFIVVALLVVLSCVVFLQGPIPQSVEYHKFADATPWLRIPNGFNVVSNIPFFIAGIYGMQVLIRAKPGTFANTKHPIAYWVLFSSTSLVAIGSAYYHLWPTTETLFCDRLPMTIAFMSIVTILLTEKVDSKWGPRTLLPFVSIGMFSVFWWLFTELHPDRIGDLRLYIVVQSAPVLLTPILLELYPHRYTHTEYMHATTGLYVVAKLCEVFDYQIYRSTFEIVSGHSLKHIVAAMGPFLLAKMLQLRKPIN